MTRPSGARWSSVGRVSPSHWRLVTSKTFCSRLELVSSGPKMRNRFALLRVTSRRYEPSTLVASAKVVPGRATSTA